MSSNRVRPLSEIANLHRDLFHEFFRPTRELLERAIEYVEESVDGNVVDRDEVAARVERLGTVMVRHRSRFLPEAGG